MNTQEATPLQVRVGQGAQQTVRVSPASLGRTPDNEVVVNHPLVSRRHLSIEWSADDGWQVIDAGSTNGMFVSGVRQTVVTVAGTTRINLGDGQTGPVLELTPLGPAAPTIVPASGGVHAQRPPTPRPATPGPATPKPVTPKPVTPGPVTPPPAPSSHPVRAQPVRPMWRGLRR
ncbi:FHA domain-containing protein [Gordonia sp. MP11Mi]|uniref:FHA domain-containing protein n=1 Tax=Gordonia sp. MP11Mi TaxID=3022769 RepID=A0AA97CYG3_9ACTN